MKSEIEYLKKMFIPMYGVALSQEEAELLLLDNSDEAKLFKAFFNTLQEQRKNVIDECVDTLLKQVSNAIYENGYNIEAVSKANILSLPALMK